MNLTDLTNTSDGTPESLISQEFVRTWVPKKNHVSINCWENDEKNPLGFGTILISINTININ